METRKILRLDCRTFCVLTILCVILLLSCKSYSNVGSFNLNNDTVLIRSNKIECRYYLDNVLRKEVHYEIVHSDPVIAGDDAVMAFMRLNDLLNTVTLREKSERHLRDVISPDYNPDLYVEVYKKERGETAFITENDKLYDFFFDRKSMRGHFVVYNNKLLLSPIIEVGQDMCEILINNFKELDANNSVSEPENVFSGSVRKNSTIEDIISHNVFSIISEGTIAIASLLDPLNQQKGDKLNGFTVIEQNKDITDDMKRGIKDALLSSKSYKVSNVIVNATFLPDVALTIIKDNSEINVLFSFYSDVVKIFDGTDEFTLDITPSKKDWATIFLSLFPEDEVLKRYQNE